ncbi:hypothetical protein [Labrys miyagiensis]|uniref:hypothetical protein n=1 Tax=Labrys miyagiensis TaxID=346912 RepID=UPI0024E19046|nr:hypothetical protein [Labrys miyagiensis]
MGAAIATIGFFSCLGAFIDFMLGKAGQTAVKKRLEDWWLRMSYVRWGNFGREEALFAAVTITRTFGLTFSFRRIVISLALVCIGCIIVLSEGGASLYILSLILVAVLLIVSFNISLSITIFIARMAGSKLLSENIYINFCYFVAAIVLQYGIMVWGLLLGLMAIISLIVLMCGYIPYFLGLHSPDTTINQLNDVWREAIVKIIAILPPSLNPLDPLFRTLQQGPVPDLPSLLYGLFIFLINFLVNALRFALALLFLLSFIFRPLKSPIMTLFARVIESDKPIFTLVCGGVAAIFQVGQQLFGALMSTGAPPHV